MSTDYVPSREDRFSFGIWTVGWQGVDVFGSAVRPPMPAERAVYKLAELGAYGVNFHDNDVFAFDATPAERDERIGAFRKALAETGLVVTTATTNLFGHPMFRDGAFTANDRQIRRFALAKVMRNLDLAADLGAKTYIFWGGREGAESGAAKDIRAALDRYAEGLNLLVRVRARAGLRHQVRDRAEAERAARRHPAAHRGERAGVHQLARALRDGRGQPGNRARGDGRAELRAQHRPGAVARQAVPHRPERAARAAVRPGPAVRRRQRARRVLGGGHARGRRLRRPGALRLQAAADRGRRGRLGVRGRLHAQLPDPAGQGTGVPGRPGGGRGAARLGRGPARLADAGPRRDLARRPRGRAPTWTRWPSAGWPTSTWTSSRSSTSTACVPSFGASRRASACRRGCPTGSTGSRWP